MGSGAFAVVYLARQLSLDRHVALKVSANRGSEARTLASLEHEHIVRVFSEEVDPAHNWRLLCMQYINGITLEQVIRCLDQREPAQWSGRAILEAIDASCTRPALFDPAALRDRDLLWNADFEEAVGWIGTRVAEALAHAHSQRVLHRDIKPANILLNRYGRPFLADFNIAFDPRPARHGARAMFGGTLGYMSPEHLDAFNPDERTLPEAVDERSDLYSLGVVFWETLTGRLPFPVVGKGSVGDSLRTLAEMRRKGPPPAPPRRALPEGMTRILRRCLHPNPTRRYASAAELARVLEGWREQRRIDRDLPAGGFLTRCLLRSPFLVGLCLLLLPHILGSMVNISYNQLRIVGQLTPAQQATFQQLVLGYNLVVYPLAMVLIVRLVRPVRRLWQRLQAGELATEEEVTAMRRRVLRLPLWTVALSCIGWLPGGVLFPLGLDLLAGPIEPAVFGRFLTSFTISGLIALTYSVFAVQFLALRVLYPRLWVDAQGLRRRARDELRSVPRRLAVLQLLAGLIPLTGAILMIAVGPEDFASGYQGFRLLLTALIGLGMLGFWTAVAVSGLLQQTFAALTGQQAATPAT
ncbi:MAG: serine/threonine protein kinase [Planctomycetia bacterium]|nr:serine/threonine protein kinase [Planctomycetia bacterium]